jgi:hypothetical protein
MVEPDELHTECNQRLVQDADIPQSTGALTKRCSKCHLWLSFDRFCVDRGAYDGLCCWCKSCKNAHYRKNGTSELWRRRNLRRFGLTPQQYDRMLADQNGVCAACHQPETCRDSWGKNGEVRSLAVDHDHKTGEVRALLCYHCNSTLGKYNEDPKPIRALAEYAEWCRNRPPSAKTVQLQLLG